MTDPKKSYTLKFTPAALRELEKLDPSVRRKAFSDVEKLRENPRPYGVQRMETKEKLCRVYVGPGRATAPSIRFGTKFCSFSW
jgi:mRNA-degrading endonuclease RelE of RelBE toxin-antitoxin system